MKSIIFSTFLAAVLIATPVSAATYTNSAGQRVSSPVKAVVVPKGATAKCKDGTYSFSKKRSGTCSGHKGVSIWY